MSSDHIKLNSGIQTELTYKVNLATINYSYPAEVQAAVGLLYGFCLCGKASVIKSQGASGVLL